MFIAVVLNFVLWFLNVNFNFNQFVDPENREYENTTTVTCQSHMGATEKNIRKVQCVCV